MKRDYFICEELKRLRQDARNTEDSLVLALHVPPQHWRKPEKAEDKAETDKSGSNVFVMNMTDYSETVVCHRRDSQRI